MSLNAEIKEKIAIEVIKVLVTRFESFPEDANNNSFAIHGYGVIKRIAGVKLC